MIEKELGQEGRRWQRYDIDCRVKVTYVRDAKKLFNFGRASDMSIGGLMLMAAMKLELGERVELEFTPPNMAEPLRLEAVVRQKHAEYSYGLEFRNITSKQSEYIHRMFEVLNVVESLR